MQLVEKQFCRQQVTSLTLPDGLRRIDCSGVSPAADALSAVEIEEIARDIEKLTAHDVSEQARDEHGRFVSIVGAYDAFKKNNAPYIIEERQGESGRSYERKVYTDEAYKGHMDTSHETGKKIRWGVNLSDGRTVSVDGAVRITQPEAWAKMERSMKGKSLDAKMSKVWTTLKPEEQKSILKSVPVEGEIKENALKMAEKSGVKWNDLSGLARQDLMHKSTRDWLVENEHPFKGVWSESSRVANCVHNQNLLWRIIESSGKTDGHIAAIAADIESLYIKAKRQASFARHDKLRDKAAAIYKRAIDRVLKKAQAEVLKNIEEHYKPETVSAHDLSPKDLKPALLVHGKPVTGGKHHADIAGNHGNDAKAALQHERNHVFVDKSGKVYDRHQAAKAIGYAHPLHSHALEKLQASEPIIKAATTPAGVQINFSLKNFTEMFMTVMGDAAEDAWYGTHEGLLEELGKDDIVTPQGLAKAFIERRANKISDCPEKIWQQIDRQIREGIQEGETMQELRERVEDAFDGVGEGRAMVIAQTESQCLYGAAQADAIERAGFKTKRWVSMDDSLVRPTHEACENEGSIPIEQPFSNGLMFPGDPDADDAGEVCNCRCYLAAGEEDEGEAYEEGA